MEESAKFILSFTTNLGTKDKYEIPRANTALTESEIISRMGEMIGNGFFATAEGKPFEAESAELIEITSTDLL